jgi:glycerol-3-phosphate dehydrogenase (NAD(P)+)
MARVTVVGAGMMGSALCMPLVDGKHDVRLVGTHLDGHIIESLRSSGVHPTLKVELPRAIHAFPIEELERAVDGADLIGVGVSSPGVAWAARTLGPYARPDLPIVMITKGLEARDGELRVLPDLLRDGLPERARVEPVAIAGPCIAGELARRVETCVVASGRDGASLERVAKLLGGPYYHVFTDRDVVGVEVCAALKNAYAMGIALADGLHERAGGTPGSVAMHNYASAVFAQAVWEMQCVVALAGGDVRSAWGLAGVGDLDVTCNGGRTGRLGRFLGLGLKAAEAIDRMQGATLECLDILRVLRGALPAFEAAGRLGAAELPLLRHLAEVALDDAPVAMPFDRFFHDGEDRPR